MDFWGAIILLMKMSQEFLFRSLMGSPRVFISDRSAPRSPTPTDFGYTVVGESFLINDRIPHVRPWLLVGLLSFSVYWLLSGGDFRVSEPWESRVWSCREGLSWRKEEGVGRDVGHSLKGQRSVITSWHGKARGTSRRMMYLSGKRQHLPLG